MENELHDYSPITERPAAPLPDGKRLAFYVGVNIEHFLFGSPSSSNTPMTAGFVPEPLDHGWRDYGTRRDLADDRLVRRGRAAGERDHQLAGVRAVPADRHGRGGA